MRITIESTNKVVEIMGRNGPIAARVWEGKTERGVDVFCIIPRIGCKAHDDCSQFEAELVAMPHIEAKVECFPLRLVL